MYSILQYQTVAGRVPFREWLLGLRDKTIRAKVRARLDRLALGYLGDTRKVGDSLFELRFHTGPGYRVYFGLIDTRAVLILLGGDKGSQARDIRRARIYWDDYLRRSR